MDEFGMSRVSINSRTSTGVYIWTLIHAADFLDEHPGGAGVILRCAGQDATESYDTVHNPELVSEMLPAETCLGDLEPNSWVRKEHLTETETARPEPAFPPLTSIIKAADFEKVAERSLSAAGWAYYSSGAEDEISLGDNRRLFDKMRLRPRILRNVETISTATRILGHPSSLPIYISPTGLGRYAHRDAETILASTAGREGLLYVMPTSPSQSHESIFGARTSARQPLFFQLYAHRDKAKAEALVRRAEALGAAAFFLTVDSPVLGRRERDDGVRVAAGEQATSSGVAKTSSSGLLNPALVWEDLAWLRGITGRPIVLKGVQTAEDAILAHAHGADGIVLSNHGGRSLDTAQAPLLVLLEIRRHAPHLLSRDRAGGFQVFLDGGVRRGTDVLKALALGASAVGMGRPFLYAMTAGYGAAGVERLVQMLRSELETNMAMLGTVCVADIRPECVNSERVEHEVARRLKL